MDLHPLAKTLNETLRNDAPSVFSLLSAKGKEIYFPVFGVLSQGSQADGTAFNASIGIALEDDSTAMRLPSIAAKIDLPPNSVFPYVGAYGLKPLRDEWLRRMRLKNPSLTVPTSTPVVTPGLTQALSIAGFLFLDPGDEFILPEPYWDNYDLTFGLMYGAHMKTFPLFSGGAFNVAGLRQSLSQIGTKSQKPKTKKTILFLNFPNNPTGYTPTLAEAKEITATVNAAAENGRDIVIIIDDAYFGLVYEDSVFPESLFALLSNLHERVLAVKIDGCTKEDYAWGLRVGFITFAGKGTSPAALKALEDKAAGVVRATASNASHLSQTLLLQAMKSPSYPEEKKQKFELLQSRYKKIKKLLNDVSDPPWTMLPCNSGYFLCLQLRDGLDAENIRQKLLKEYDTGLIALGNLIRIAFSSLPESKMEKFVENLVSACS